MPIRLQANLGLLPHFQEAAANSEVASWVHRRPGFFGNPKQIGRKPLKTPGSLGWRIESSILHRAHQSRGARSGFGGSLGLPATSQAQPIASAVHGARRLPFGEQLGRANDSAGRLQHAVISPGIDGTAACVKLVSDGQLLYEIKGSQSNFNSLPFQQGADRTAHFDWPSWRPQLSLEVICYLQPCSIHHQYPAKNCTYISALIVHVYLYI